MATDYSKWLWPVGIGIATYAVVKNVGGVKWRKRAGMLGILAGTAGFVFMTQSAFGAEKTKLEITTRDVLLNAVKTGDCTGATETLNKVKNNLQLYSPAAVAEFQQLKAQACAGAAVLP